MGMFDKIIKGTYQVRVRCLNCGREGFTDILKGTPTSEISSKRCNVCGVTSLEVI